MKNNPLTVSKAFKVLTEKELQQVCGGDKHTKIIIRDLFKKGKNNVHELCVFYSHWITLDFILSVN